MPRPSRRSSPRSLLALAPAALLAPVLAPPSASQAAGPQRPNVLLLVADDLGVDVLRAYGLGPQTPATPALDALAAGGVIFDSAWAAPVCSPARALLQTGRYAFRTGLGYGTGVGPQAYGLPASEVTLPQMLDVGTGGAYAHAAFGKWHLGTDAVGGELAPNLAGYGHFAGCLGNFTGADDYFSWTKYVDGVAAPASGYATSDTVDSALAWLAGAPEPWFCYVAFNAPHEPFHAPPAQLHSVDLSAADPDPTQDPRPYYEAMVEALDTEIGRLLAGLPGGGLAETVVLFLGDNGTPGRATLPPFDPARAKGSLFEGGVRVPLIVHGPGVVAGGACSAPVSAVDVFATVAELAGVDLAGALPGVRLDSVSFAPQLADPSAGAGRRFLFAEQFFPNAQPAAAPLLAPCADPAVCGGCQPSLGAGAATELTVCGVKAYGFNQERLELAGAQPGAAGLLALSLQLGPSSLSAGTLLPASPAFSSFVTDSLGGFAQTGVWGLQAPQAVYVQALTASGSGFELSNAVAIGPLRTHVAAVRDQRYKLIANLLTGEQWLFDLAADPFEDADLLAAGPSPAEAAAHAELVDHLRRLYPGAACAPGCVVEPPPPQTTKRGGAGGAGGASGLGSPPSTGPAPGPPPPAGP